MINVLLAVGTQIGQFIERKQAEEQHRLSEMRLQAILDNSPAVIHVKDLQGRYIVTSRRFQQLFHVSREDVIGKSPHDLFLGRVRALLNNDQKVLAKLAPVEFEEILPVDGELHTYISVKFPLLDATGVPYALCGISTDITERKRAELALRQSQERLALVIQGSSDGVWDWDIATNEVYFSPRWKSMLGYADQEVEDHFSSWERLLHPPTGSAPWPACKPIFLAGPDLRAGAPAPSQGRQLPLDSVARCGAARRRGQTRPHGRLACGPDATDRPKNSSSAPMRSCPKTKPPAVGVTKAPDRK